MKSEPAKGAYALVFKDRDQRRVYKLFKTSAWSNAIGDAACLARCKVKVTSIGWAYKGSGRWKKM